MLQTRLSTVMADVVNEHQACAIPGRSIHSNMILLRDIIDYTKVKMVVVVCSRLIKRPSTRWIGLFYLECFTGWGLGTTLLDGFLFSTKISAVAY